MKIPQYPDWMPISYLAADRGLIYGDVNGPVIDLGLGRSPIGPPPELKRLLMERDAYKDLSSYPVDPSHESIKRIILEGIGLAGMPLSSLLLSYNGSFGAGDEIIRMLSQKGYRTILAPPYSFPDIYRLAVRHKIRYLPVRPETLDPLESAEYLLNYDNKRLRGKIVYFDCPNNPFGAADTGLIKTAVRHVSSMGGIPLLDLAFGEVLGEEFIDMIHFTVDNRGVCLCSLSKTIGLPGLRSGYAILSPELAGLLYSRAEWTPFSLNREAEYIYRILFLCSGGKCLARVHAERVAAYNLEVNRKLYDGLQKMGLRMGKTDLRTHIQVVFSNRSDFYRSLYEEGIICESLADFKVTLYNGRESIAGYDDSAVRMLTPGPGNTEEVLKRVELALQRT